MELKLDRNKTYGLALEGVFPPYPAHPSVRSTAP